MRFHGNLWQTWNFIRDPVFSSFYKNSQQGLALALHRFASLTLNCFKKFLSTITLMFLQIYQTAPDKLLYKDGFLLQFVFDICWLVKIHRECKERKRIWMENMKKNPYSGNFRQLFIFCQLVLDFKQVIYNLREWIKQSRWVRVNWVLQVLMRFSKVTRFPFILNLC